MKKFILSLLFATLAPLLGLRAEMPGSETLLLGGANVQTELGLSPRQCRKIDLLRSEYRAAIQPLLLKDNASSAKALEILTTEFDAKSLALLTPSQRVALEKIQFKMLGPWILHDPSAQSKLGLSEQQKQKIASVAAKTNALNAKLSQKVLDGKITPATRINELRAYRLKQSLKLTKTLTPEQKVLFQKLGAS